MSKDNKFNPSFLYGSVLLEGGFPVGGKTGEHGNIPDEEGGDENGENLNDNFGL